MYIHETDVHNTKAAEEVVPLIIKRFSPKSVLDVGCGIGTWLSVFKKLGVANIIGLDGDYVNKELLYENILPNEFLSCNLVNPFNLNKKYDLVICLEVAEHLPLESASSLIKSLCVHTNTVIFGAAIPGQGGQNHLNEQWPEYWIELFQDNGFAVYDVLRPQIWNNKNVDWWYRQNIFVFSTKDIQIDSRNLNYYSIIHPAHFNQKLEYNRMKSDELAKLEPELIKWENGEMGVRKHWKSLYRSLLKKIR